MPTLRDVGTSCQAATLDRDEIWQARGGSVLTTNEAVTDAEQGIVLAPNCVRTFRSGMTVNYRAIKPAGVRVDVILAREAI